MVLLIYTIKIMNKVNKASSYHSQEYRMISTDLKL
jgi:hypothetical protein